MIPGILEVVTAVGGLIIPPLFNVLKSKVLGIPPETEKDTLASLARTNPEAMAGYVTAQANLVDSQVKFFNRDIVGDPSRWVIDLRAAIRPGVTLLCVSALIVEMTPVGSIGLDQGTRATMCLIVSSWFGDRLFSKGAK